MRVYLKMAQQSGIRHAGFTFEDYNTGTYGNYRNNLTFQTIFRLMKPFEMKEYVNAAVQNDVLNTCHFDHLSLKRPW